MKADLDDIFQDLRQILWIDDDLHNVFYLRLQRIFEHIGELQDLRSTPQDLNLFVFSILYNHFEDIFSYLDMLEECDHDNELLEENDYWEELNTEDLEEED